MTRKRVDIDVDDLVRQYLAGESEYRIANDLGISRVVIRHRLLERGIVPRDRSAAGLVRASRMTAQQRRDQTAAANRASRGRTPGRKELCQSAMTRQIRQIGISDMERGFADLLRRRDISFTQQLALGMYNCDFAIHPVAVEIFGGSWHWYGDHIRRTPERIRYFLNRGWHILMVTDYGGVPFTGDTADYVVAYVQKMRRNPSVRREYRVVRGAGEILATGSADDDEISIKLTFRSRTDMRERKNRYIALRRSGISRASVRNTMDVPRTTAVRWDTFV